MNKALIISGLLLTSNLCQAENRVILAWDNDRFCNEDQGYTNGVEAAISQTQEKGISQAWGLGHQIFTPRHPGIQEEQPNDRPYAGWLFLAHEKANTAEHRAWATRWSVGLVGPGAGARILQNKVHHLLGIPRFQGWHNQLHNEMTFQLTHTQWWRTRGETRKKGFAMEMAAHVDGSLGNVHTSGTLGGIMRWGWNMGEELPGAEQGAYGWTGPWAAPEVKEQWTVFGWIGLEGRGSLRDITLDGNTFRNSARISKNGWTGQASLGISVFHGAWQTSFTWHRKTREFHGQEETPRWGSLVMSRSF